MTSAWSITRAVNPPRAAYLDFPLGHTAGKPHDAKLNLAILRAALDVFATATRPGEIVRLPFEWADDDAWKDGVMRPGRGESRAGDSRVERHDTPQYQTQEDREAADAAGECRTCVWLDAP